ncbi:hypothetical protein VTN02DRAFT_4651 [Thermoascus thermophilus]
MRPATEFASINPRARGWIPLVVISEQTLCDPAPAVPGQHTAYTPTTSVGATWMDEGGNRSILSMLPGSQKMKSRAVLPVRSLLLVAWRGATIRAAKKGSRTTIRWIWTCRPLGTYVERNEEQERCCLMPRPCRFIVAPGQSRSASVHAAFGTNPGRAGMGCTAWPRVGLDGEEAC